MSRRRRLGAPALDGRLPPQLTLLAAVARGYNFKCLGVDVSRWMPRSSKPAAGCAEQAAMGSTPIYSRSKRLHRGQTVKTGTVVNKKRARPGARPPTGDAGKSAGCRALNFLPFRLDKKDRMRQHPAHRAAGGDVQQHFTLVVGQVRAVQDHFFFDLVDKLFVA